MQLQLKEFLLHLDRFMNEFKLDTTPEGRAEKLFVEVNEFKDAFLDSTEAHADDEAIDVLITALANVHYRGIPNILDTCLSKLDRSARKYRRRQEDLGKIMLARQ